MGKGLFDRLEGELEAREQSLGLKMANLLMLSEPLFGLLNWMIRKGQVTLADIVTFLGSDEASARVLLADVVEQGYVREIMLHEKVFYRVRLATKRGNDLLGSLWQELEKKCGEEGEA